MATGVVKFFNKSKGFGFITPDEGDTPVFVDQASIEQGAIATGSRVSYTLKVMPKGLEAIQVKLINA